MKIKNNIAKKLVTLKVGKIRPYWKNPRLNEETVKVLEQSIERYGYIAPLVVDEDSVIIIGHARFKALIKLGYKEIDVIVADMGEAKAREYRLIDNKIAEASGWDEDILMDEIVAIGSPLKEFQIFNHFYRDKDAPTVFDEDDYIRGKRYGDMNDDEKAEAQGLIAEMNSHYNLIRCPHCDESFEAYVEEEEKGGKKKKSKVKRD